MLKTWDVLYRMCRRKMKHEAISLVLDYFDDRLRDGRYEECDRAMRMLDPRKVYNSVSVAILGITHAGKDRLVDRPDFYKRTFRTMWMRKGWCYTRKLLVKYK